MTISYRARRRFRKLFIALLALILLTVVAVVIWFVWVERYIVFDADGAHIDRDFQPQGNRVVAQAPVTGETVPIRYNEGDNAIDLSTDLKMLNGYYVSTEVLLEDFEGVRDTIETLPNGTAVMIDLKSGLGNFYYSTQIPNAPRSDSIDTAAMDSLIDYLRRSNLYTIARVPAFRDRTYALDHQPSGIAYSSGALWVDDERCYWMHPGATQTRMYMAQIIEEVRNLGFDEIVFGDFYFPSDSKIAYASDLDKGATLKSVASELISAYATETFAVSFETTGATFELPEGRTRMFQRNLTAGEAMTLVENVQVGDKNTQLVFVTDSNDTRFNNYGVLRPLRIQG